MKKEELKKQALAYHAKKHGKISIVPKTKLKTKKDLSLAYTPGVAAVALDIAKDKKKAYDYTMKNNTVAIVSDGTAVLGLGDIGPEGGLPIMEGKAAIFKAFADVDAVPLCIDTKDPKEIIKFCTYIAPTFGAIQLEDISAPRCFEIEEALQELPIPVMHDDQHGTAVVVLAGLINSCKVLKKNIEDLIIVINGAGAAGIAIANLLKCVGYNLNVCTRAKDVIVCDSKGIIHKGRGSLNKYKERLLKHTNLQNKTGSLADAIKGADVFIGVSVAGALTGEMIKTMNKDPIIFAMANPVPEIMPDVAKKAGAAIIATGRSDFQNQVNNAVVYPGMFKGMLAVRTERRSKIIEIASAHAVAKTVKKPTRNKILPDVFDKRLAKNIVNAIKRVHQ